MPMKEIDPHEYTNPGLIVLLSNSQPLAPTPPRLPQLNQTNKMDPK